MKLDESIIPCSRRGPSVCFDDLQTGALPCTRQSAPVYRTMRCGVHHRVKRNIRLDECERSFRRNDQLLFQKQNGIDNYQKYDELYEKFITRGD